MLSLPENNLECASLWLTFFLKAAVGSGISSIFIIEVLSSVSSLNCFLALVSVGVSMENPDLDLILHGNYFELAVEELPRGLSFVHHLPNLVCYQECLM